MFSVSFFFILILLLQLVTVGKVLYASPDEIGPRVIDIQDFPIPQTAYLFRFEDMRHPRLKLLRKQEGLDAVIKGARTDLERFVRLRNWTNKQWKHSIPKPYPPWDALIILDWIRKGKTGGFCAQYAVVFLQACLSLGLQGRYVDINREGGGGHFVTEVWCNELARWVVMDPDYNIHYEKDGVPLSALELHRAWVEGWWRKVKIVKGKDMPSFSSIDSISYGLIDYYQHFSIDMRNNHLSVPIPFWNRWNGYLSWRDEHTDGRPGEHSRFVSRPEELYWPLNSVQVSIKRSSRRDVVRVSLDTITPNLSQILLSLDNGPWRPSPREFTWTLHSGKNTLRVRTLNIAGYRGPISRVTIVP